MPLQHFRRAKPDVSCSPLSRFALHLVIFCSLVAWSSSVAFTETDKAKPDEHAAPSSDYVGSDTCKTCHEDLAKHFEQTAHFATIQNKKATAAHQGCEGCHGPGKAHVDGGGDVSKIISFKNLSGEESSKRCLECHSGEHEQGNFLRSSHASADVGCTSCHSPHKAWKEKALLTEKQPQLCYQCHTETRAEFDRPFRHRVNQGLIECGDCHNPHGGTHSTQLRASADEDQVCYKCHREKKGPFVFEHLPVKTEGCVSCHMPHGSTSPRLLKVAQVNQLCLQCHTLALSNVPSQPPIGPAHNQAQKYQACTMCHAFIHGSNFSEVFFKP
ncbi:MAG TPA: DmsE family decaheme c-type cytochrome [Terriglobales bacterium]|nr:DmsE family decaheme c-type cytochrome [Terriglobales bacterium]